MRTIDKSRYVQPNYDATFTQGAWKPSTRKPYSSWNTKDFLWGVVCVVGLISTVLYVVLSIVH
jgi:hypothetical protein